MNEQLTAAEAWCRLTNALNARYKSMTEENPNQVIKEVCIVENFLISHGFLTEEDLDRALH